MHDILTLTGALVGVTAIALVALTRGFARFRGRLSSTLAGGLLTGGFALYAAALLPVPLLESWLMTLLLGVVVILEMATFSLLTKAPPQV